jgi:hypothetical protein
MEKRIKKRCGNITIERFKSAINEKRRKKDWRMRETEKKEQEEKEEKGRNKGGKSKKCNVGI